MNTPKQSNTTKKDKIQFIGFFGSIGLAIIISGILYDEIWTYYTKPILGIILLGSILFFAFGYNRKKKE